MPLHIQKPSHLCLGFRTCLNMLLHITLLGWGHCWAGLGSASRMPGFDIPPLLKPQTPYL